MKKKYSAKDIAEKLGISTSTVSRAIRDSHDVSAETRKKVLELAHKLKFKPNKNASALASGATMNIGVVLPFITNYYFSTVISGIQDEAYRQGYNIILYVTNDDKEKERDLLENMDVSMLDGLLISISSNTIMQDHFEKLLEDGLPIVFFDKVPAEIRASKVVQNDFEGAYSATKHLIDCGYTKIAHIAGPQHLSFTRLRINGYLRALKRFRIPYREEYIIHSGFSQENGFDDTLKLLALRDPPNAIFAVNDRKGVGAILALKKMHISVGTSFGVIGFTNDPISTIVEPNLSTIEEPAFEIGKQSCFLLIKHIKYKNYEIENNILSGKLIARASAKTI